MNEAWALLELFAVVCVLVLVLAWLLPAGTPLWHLVGLAAGVVVLLAYGPDALAQLLAVAVEAAASPPGSG